MCIMQTYAWAGPKCALLLILHVKLHMWKRFQSQVSNLRAFVNVSKWTFTAFLMRGSVGSSKHWCQAATSSINLLNWFNKHNISLYGISLEVWFPWRLDWLQAVSPWHPSQTVAAALREQLIKLFAGRRKKNLICGPNEQLLCVIK